MSVSKDSHSIDVETICATKRSTSNRKSKAVAAHPQSEKEQETCQEPQSIKEAFIRMLPRDFPTVLRSLITLACLYDFIRTGNATMLLTAYAMSTGAPGLPFVKALLPHKKETVGEDDTK
jgi:hypothetical protein